MKISKKDIIWNYLATFLKIASAALLLPLILVKFPRELVGIWSVFVTIYSFITLFDFGFNPSFTRNVTYVFSGVNELKITGYEILDNEQLEVTNEQKVNYGLLKALIESMKRYYGRTAIISFFILITVGTFYIYTILKDYTGSHTEIYVSWLILVVSSSYTLYTYYFDCLIQGKGMIMRDKQINVIGQLLNIGTSVFLIYFGFQLIAIVAGQLISVVIMRIMLYRTFFTKKIKKQLNLATVRSHTGIMKTIYPNAIKIGLTTLGAFLVTKSAIIIGTIYLPLNEMASYGITLQMVTVVSGLSSIYLATFVPKIVNLRVLNKTKEIRDIVFKSYLVMLLTFSVGGGFLIFFAPWILKIIGSGTPILSLSLTLLILVGAIIESSVSISGTILLTKNYVPFFKASLLSGAAIVLGLFLFFEFFSWGVLTIIIVPIIINIAYQGWKWPLEVFKDLKLSK